MSTLILGPGGTAQEVILDVKHIAATLGLADRFLYFAFDVDRAIESHDGLLPEERLWLRMADREDLRQHAAQRPGGIDRRIDEPEVREEREQLGEIHPAFEPAGHARRHRSRGCRGRDVHSWTKTSPVRTDTE